MGAGPSVAGSAFTHGRRHYTLFDVLASPSPRKKNVPYVGSLDDATLRSVKAVQSKERLRAREVSFGVGARDKPQQSIWSMDPYPSWSRRGAVNPTFGAKPPADMCICGHFLYRTLFQCQKWRPFLGRYPGVCLGVNMSDDRRGCLPPYASGLHRLYGLWCGVVGRKMAASCKFFFSQRKDHGMFGRGSRYR
ncbi:hypothetical protein LZ32DRAFT_92825 [Colletotrichum eremochloae]|nr:hypothetical protein LZ32DRAFT_92825 [Colletotrichum eremochloae]